MIYTSRDFIISATAAAAASAKLLQSCLTLWDPIDRQPTRLPCPLDSLGKNTGLDCHFLLQCMKVKSQREVAQSCPTLWDPMDRTYQAPPPLGFSRQEYWSGLSFPSPIAKLRKVKTNFPFITQEKYDTLDLNSLISPTGPFSKGGHVRQQM